MNRVLPAALTAVGLAACDPTGLGVSNPAFRVVAHRGAPNLVCENTMPSFEVAAALGANAIETDICVTAAPERQLVIWHDRDPDDTVAVARQTGVEGLLCIPQVPAVGSSWRRPVGALALNELRAHYGYGPLEDGRDPTYTIPLLAELIEWLAHNDDIHAVYLDLKLTASELADAIRVLHMVTEDPRVALVRFYLLSVHPEVVRGLEAERVSIGAENARVVWDFEGSGALGGTLSAGLRDVSFGLVPSQSWHGYKEDLADIVNARERREIDSVTVWTFDREMQLAELLYYSVDAVMTNEPGTLHRLWLESLK